MMIVDSSNLPVPVDTSIGTNFGAAEIDLLPVARDLRSIVLLSPSASGERSLMIAGAPSWDSLFLIDGVVANEYQTGQPHPIVFEDAIQEIVVLSGGISAEYGRFTGGGVSTITDTNVASDRTEGRVLDRESLIPERRQPLRFFALTSTSVLPAQWFTELHYSTRSAALRGNGGRSTDRILGTLLTVRATNTN